MIYKQIYDDIIELHGFSEKPDEDYYERHHVVPKCLGGTDKKSNLVYVKARVHYLLHWLLYKIHGGHGLSTAWFRTAHCSLDGKRRVNSYQYQNTKSKMSKECSIKYSGEGNPMFGKSWNKGKKGVQDYSFMKGKNNPRSKNTYLVVHPNGKEMIVETISDFCKQNNLSTSHLRNVALGKTKQHKGFTAKIIKETK